MLGDHPSIGWNAPEASAPTPIVFDSSDPALFAAVPPVYAIYRQQIEGAFDRLSLSDPKGWAILDLDFEILPHLTGCAWPFADRDLGPEDRDIAARGVCLAVVEILAAT